MEIDSLTIAFGAIGAVVGFLLNIMTLTRNRDNDVKRKATEQATINTKLDTISSGIDDLRVDIKVEQKERVIIAERVTRTEESVKQAHKRIDEMEKHREDH